MSYVSKQNVPNPETPNLLGSKSPAAQQAHQTPQQTQPVGATPPSDHVKIRALAAGWKNDSGKFAVLAGMQWDSTVNNQASVAAVSEVQVLDSDATTILDSAAVIHNVTAVLTFTGSPAPTQVSGAAGGTLGQFILQGLPRRMLVPPGGKVLFNVAGTGTAFTGQAILCGPTVDSVRGFL